jgi:hypothetical protein
MISALALILFQAATGVGQPAPPPVVIVDDAQQIRAWAGPGVDSTFTPGPVEAEAPRRDLARYIDAELRTEKKNKYRKEQLGQIRRTADRYHWYCGGYTRKKEKFLFCSFVRQAPPDTAQARKSFPEINDGGASVCRCHYDLRAGKIVRLEWNGEA